MPVIYKKFKHNSPECRNIVDGIKRRWEFSREKMNDRYAAWAKAEDQALLYVPTREVEAQRKALKAQGKPQYVTVNVPYSYAQMLAAHTYWTSVFLSRSPVHQFIGRHGYSTDSEQAVEAIIDYQVQTGGALLPYYLWFHDVGKYGLGVIGTYWDEELHQVTEVVEEPVTVMGVSIPGSKRKIKRTMQVPGYKGNRVYNVRPQDFFPDPRVPLSRFQDGEFVGRYVEVGWNFIKRREAAGYYFNVEDLAKTTPSNWRRDTGSPRNQLPNTARGINTAGVQDGGRPNTKLDYVELLEMYVELIPADWGLGDSKMPEKWCFTLGNGTVLIGCWPLGLNHNKYPFDIMEYEIEAYGLFKRSMLEMLEPLNDTLTWLFNSHFYNVRKMLNDQLVIDPSRVVLKDMADSQSGRIIRLKPAGYGSDPRTAFAQLQFSDVTANHLNGDARAVMSIMAQLVGVNENIMGMVNQGGRKSASEIRSSNAYGVNRLKTNAEIFSAQGWAPHAQKLLASTQQFYDQEQNYRIAGNLLDRAQAYINVTPDLIAGAFDFVSVDGTMPVDRQAQAMVFGELMKQMGMFPQLLAEYDINSMFGFVAQLAGIRNIQQFKVRVQPDEQLKQAALGGELTALSQGEMNELTGGSRPNGGAGKVTSSPSPTRV